jgi:hypothetical protein
MSPAAHQDRPACAPIGWRTTAGDAARISVAILAAIQLVATIVAVGAAPLARHLLAFPFTGVPATPGQALAIFAHNARMLAAIGGLLLIAQSPLRTVGTPGRASRALRQLGELWLGGIGAANILVVGAAVGAYGDRMIRTLLPHGPVELAAYAFMVALYRHGRHAALAPRDIATVAAASAGLLALAAALETFLTV